MQTPTSDPLRRAFQSILDWCDAHGVQKLYGSVDSDNTMLVRFEGEDEHGITEDFLAAVAKLSPRLVVLYRVVITDEEHAAALEFFAQTDRSTGWEQRRDRVAQCRSAIGCIAHFSVDMIIADPPMVIRHELAIDDFDLIYNPEDQIEEPDDDLGDADEDEWTPEELEREQWLSGERRQALVQRLADDPDFQQCRNEPERLIIFRQVASDDAPATDYIIREIVREAKAIVQVKARSTKRR